MNSRKTTLAAIGFVLLLSGLKAQGPEITLPPFPYLPGSSVGPIGTVADPVYENDLLTYGNAYWALLDSGGSNTFPMQSFVPASPKWFPQGPSTQPPSDHDPFGDGLVLFRSLYLHRLQLNPAAGPLFNIEDLILTDYWVRQQFRHWSRTHQLVTATFMDPVAHQRHLNALINAFTTATEYTTLGVPFFDGALTILCSENTKKLKGPGQNPPPAPLPLANETAAVQAKDALVRQRAGALSGFPTLYDPDGWWFGGHVGFDCDDFADAIGTYITKGQAGMAATTVRVTWTDSNGASQAHRVTKITCGTKYWLVDAQTGAVDGPYDTTTAADARNVVGGYDVDATKPVVTTDDGRALGSRPGFGEPPAWFNDPAQVQRFQNITGLDPACFH